MRLLLESEQYYGIELVRINLGKIITEKSNGIQIIYAKECSELTIDAETGGIWYRLDPAASAIPVTGQLIYVAPAAIVQIAFNSAAKTNDH